MLVCLSSDGTVITVNMQHGTKRIRLELYRVRESYELAELWRHAWKREAAYRKSF